jgi:hypothetical protein
MLHKLATTETGANATTELVIRGQKVSQAKVERFLKRTVRDRSALGKADRFVVAKGRCRTARPLSPIPTLPTRISLPDHLRLPEELIQISNQYIAGGCEGIWAPGRSTGIFASEAIIDWNCKIYAAIVFIQKGQWKEAFAMLNTCFDRFKVLLADPMPGFFTQLYIVTIWLPPEIGERLLGYAAQMSTILLPANHPLSIAFNKLHEAGFHNLIEHAWVIIRSHLHMGGQRFLGHKMDMFEFNPTIESHITATGSDMVHTTDPSIATHMKRAGWTEVFLRSELCITWVLFHSKNYDQVSVQSKALRK